MLNYFIQGNPLKQHQITKIFFDIIGAKRTKVFNDLYAVINDLPHSMNNN